MDEIINFLNEYKELCKKYHMMVVDDRYVAQQVVDRYIEDSIKSIIKCHIDND